MSKLRIAVALCAFSFSSLMFVACSRDRLLVGAIMSKNVARARLLLDAGAPVNERYEQLQMTPLMTAALVGSPEMTQLLIDRGAEVNARATDGRTALHMIVGTRGCETAKVLAANGADLNAKARWGVTPLVHAVILDDAETVKCVIELGADPNVQSDGGTTALKQAVWSGDVEIVKILLAAGADISIKDEEGKTAKDVLDDMICSGIHDRHSEEVRELLTTESNRRDKERQAKGRE